MKCSLFTLLVILLRLGAQAVPFKEHRLTRDLNDDLNDLLALIPGEEIFNIINDYLSQDEDFGEFLDYILSDEFRQFIVDVENMPEVRELLNIIQGMGVDAYKILNTINKLLGIDEITPRLSIFNCKRISGGLSGFVKDIKAVLPLDKIEKLVKIELETSKDFTNLVNHLNSKKSQKVISRVIAHPKLQRFIKIAKGKGLNVQELLDLITSISGIHILSIKPAYFVVSA